MHSFPSTEPKTYSCNSQCPSPFTIQFYAAYSSQMHPFGDTEKLLGQECLQRKLVMSPGLQPEWLEVPLWRQSK